MLKLALRGCPCARGGLGEVGGGPSPPAIVSEPNRSRHPPAMGSTPSPTVSPFTLGLRAERAAQGEDVARELRDASLAAAGGIPDAVALIGGPSVRQDGWEPTARWLAALATASGLLPVVAALNLGRTGRQQILAPALAARALARQLLDRASAAVEELPFPVSDTNRQNALNGDAVAVGRWLAGAIEAAGLSAEFRALLDAQREPSTSRER